MYLTILTTCLLLNSGNNSTLSIAEVTCMANSIGPKYGIEPELLVAIAKVESNFNPNAIGRSHKEVGLMQLHPKYFKNAPKDPIKNMELAANHLKKLKKSCKKYGKAYFVCYNRGANRPTKAPKQLAYYKKVTNARKATSRRLVSSPN